MKEHIMRLSRDNKQLKSALSKSQEEVKKLKSVIEMHELQTKTSSKEDSKAATRYWTDAEHQRFLDALQAHGPKDVKAIAQQVGTRSATQVRTHAQKYFIKLARMKKSAEEAAKAGVPASAHGAWWLQVCPSQMPISASRSTGFIANRPRFSWARTKARAPLLSARREFTRIGRRSDPPGVRMRAHTHTN
jgi:SHAQKYF class myb-like DNA-binding protein